MLEYLGICLSMWDNMAICKSILEHVGTHVETYRDKYDNLWGICRNMLEHARMYGNMWAQNENLLQYVRTGQGNMWGTSWNA